MSDVQSNTDISTHETRLKQIEKYLWPSGAPMTKKTVLQKIGAVYMGFHSELYHWLAHAKDAAYILAALGVFALCLRLAYAA